MTPGGKYGYTRAEELAVMNLVFDAKRLPLVLLELYASRNAELSFVWRNAFGENSGKNLKTTRVAPGLWRCEPDCPAGGTGMLEIRGRGEVFDLRY